MKFNSTVALTLILLAMMLGAGFVSAMWGFTLGHEALKGVTQPDVRPVKDMANNQKAPPGKEGISILREADILVQVNEHIKNGGKDAKPEKKESKPENKEKNQDDQANNSNQSFINNQQTPDGLVTQASFTTTSSGFNTPIKSEDRGVTLEIHSANQQGGSLLLNVKLKNQGGDAVRFLYSFLNVTDEQGRALSAITEGLPGELPADGKEYSGTVSIPTALIENAQKLSLSLTDYPDQKLQLKMSGIPVVR